MGTFTIRFLRLLYEAYCAQSELEVGDFQSDYLGDRY